MHVLIPRLSTGAAMTRLTFLQEELQRNTPAKDLVIERLELGVPNPTGGRAATEDDLRCWRSGVLGALEGRGVGSTSENAAHSMHLGRAIVEVIRPSPSDGAHDGSWSFLSLMLFPDVLAARWPASDNSSQLAKDRWIGKQVGRDRNYLKLAWRRWQVLGLVMSETQDAFGEDEFGALLERSAVARNGRLVQLAAREVAAHEGQLGRMEFTRALMRGLTALTGPLQLDVLSDEELAALVETTAAKVNGR